MDIRKTTKGCCRTCEQEACDATWRHPTTPTYSKMSSDEMCRISNEYNAIKRELDIANREELYALDAQTASGIKTEIICKRHLKQFIDIASTYFI